MTRCPVMSRDEVSAFIDREFPQIHYDGRLYQIEAVGPLTARVRLDFHERHVRPGGPLSGPAMMTLADFALYVAILAHIGPVALTVTTNLSFNFCASRQPGTASWPIARCSNSASVSPSVRSPSRARARSISSAMRSEPIRSRRGSSQ